MIVIADLLQYLIRDQTCVHMSNIPPMEMCKPLRRIDKISPDFVSGKLIEVYPGVEASGAEQVRPVIVKIEVAENIGAFLLREVLSAIACPYLVCKNTDNALWLLLLNSL